MGKLIDLTGQRFGRWTIIKHKASTKYGVARWLCRCDCGAISIIEGASLKRGSSTSCGCYRKDSLTTHGESSKKTGTKEYRIWYSMKARCLSVQAISYKHYGGRGIKVCDRWLNYENFLSDMGRCPDGLTIERDDNNGNYEPGNCMWASIHKQNRNRRDNVWVTAPNGESLIIHDWGARLNLAGAHWEYWRKKGLTNKEILKHFIEKRGI